MAALLAAKVAASALCPVYRRISHFRCLAVPLFRSSVRSTGCPHQPARRLGFEMDETDDQQADKVG